MSERETITCEHCHMVQFRTKADVCRRCHKSTAPPAPVAEPEPLREIVMFPEGTAEELSRATQLTLAARRGKMSQRQLAKKLGCPRTWISKVEQGRAVPIMASLERFARAFRIPLWVLVLEIETMRALLTATRESQ